MTIASLRRRAQRVGDHVCQTCGSPGRFYRVGRHARLETVCFRTPSHGTLRIAPLRAGAGAVS